MTPNVTYNQVFLFPQKSVITRNKAENQQLSENSVLLVILEKVFVGVGVYIIK